MKRTQQQQRRRRRRSLAALRRADRSLAARLVCGDCAAAVCAATRQLQLVLKKVHFTFASGSNLVHRLAAPTASTATQPHKRPPETRTVAASLPSPNAQPTNSRRRRRATVCKLAPKFFPFVASAVTFGRTPPTFELRSENILRPVAFLSGSSLARHILTSRINRRRPTQYLDRIFRKFY